ncbi:MAG TPA: outer membrane protein assembly factor BamD [Fibrobacteria bacterium]|nr:outer membrane protein assembly factor BamD [Fibrobacteria bacterium]
MRASNRLRAASLGLAALALASCSSIKPAAEAPDKVCRAKFDAGKKSFEKGRDPEAQEKLRDISVNCAAYDYAEEAQYMLGESHYRTEQWMEAQTEFQILVDHWERSKHLDEARWKIVHSAYQQAPSWDRDPALIESALMKAEEFLADYSTGEQADSARDLREDLIGRLADRRYETARLYLKMDEPQAATIYYQLLLKEFPQSKRVPVARMEMAKAYAMLDQFERATETLDTLKLETAKMEQEKAALFGERIAITEKFVEKSRRKFEARKLREAKEARQDKL